MSVAHGAESCFLKVWYIYIEKYGAFIKAVIIEQKHAIIPDF